MTYDEINPVLRTFFGAREGFRKLGFAAEELFFTTARSVLEDGALAVFCTLKTQGKSFLVECGPAGDEDAITKEYVITAEAINSGSLSQGDLDRIWQECDIRRQPLDFLLALSVKGIVIPPVKR